MYVKTYIVSSKKPLFFLRRRHERRRGDPVNKRKIPQFSYCLSRIFRFKREVLLEVTSLTKITRLPVCGNRGYRLLHL